MSAHLKRPALALALLLAGCSGGSTLLIGAADAGPPAAQGDCVDSDGDGELGTGLCPAAMVTDCNDHDYSVHPGAHESCNGIDDDCDGEIDEGLPRKNFFLDADGDGHGGAQVMGLLCAPPRHDLVTSNDDCDDSRDDVHPGAAEVCNGRDDDCDGQVDEGLPLSTWHPDSDGDGYGAATSARQACGPLPGFVENQADCDDANGLVHPGARELCDGLDQNCNGEVDEGLSLLNYYADADGDGHGSRFVPAQRRCGPAPGLVASNDDCVDSNAAIHPGASELCNGLDDDCDGLIDEDLTLTRYYPDADSDGHGSTTATPLWLCGPRAGFVASKDDCNDANRAVFPGASEVCNGLDDDCDGTADELNPGGGATCTSALPGLCAAGVVTCTAGTLRCQSQQAPAAERCDGLDNDCDGQTDETFADKGQPCVAGLGACGRSGNWVCAPNAAQTICSAVPGAREPGACDGRDNDCDGTVDEPTLGGATQIHPNPWQDFEVQPYYFSATGCAGGVNGAGTDALAGGGVAIAVQPGVGGIRYLQLDLTGAPVGLTWILHSTYQYLDVDLAQAGDGFLVAGVYTPNPMIDLYYRSYAGTNRTTLENQLRPAAGNTLDSLRLVRGNGRRVVVLYREAGPVTASTGLKLAEVEPYYDAAAGTWALRDARTQAATLSSVTLVPGPIAAGLGADSTHLDWSTSQPCQSTSVQRTIAVAYLASAQSLRTFTLTENGTGKSVETVVRTETGARTLGEPHLTWFTTGTGDQYFIAFTSADAAAGYEELQTWLTTRPTVQLAWEQPASANGADSVSRPRASVAGSRIWLTALRAVADPSGFKSQVMSRWFTFAGARDPASTATEVLLTSGACPGSQPECQPGDKGGLANWAAAGRVFFSTNGGSLAHSVVGTLSCD